MRFIYEVKDFKKTAKDGVINYVLFTHTGPGCPIILFSIIQFVFVAKILTKIIISVAYLFVLIEQLLKSMFLSFIK